ncbi:heme exporter protein CcmD [Marinobacter lacisalsi]|uniref:Heme exporter protein D n=1 Tax=Marinobacter lacisalsi TaxID=475979 RepID=A0ABV8QF19_9GAMM
MAFDSLSAFIHMEGHGPYVWTCYGGFFLLLGLLAWYSVLERRQVVRAQRFQHQLNATRESENLAWGRTSGGASFQRIQSSHNESASKP